MFKKCIFYQWIGENRQMAQNSTLQKLLFVGGGVNKSCIRPTLYRIFLRGRDSVQVNSTHDGWIKYISNHIPWWIGVWGTQEVKKKFKGLFIFFCRWNSPKKFRRKSVIIERKNKCLIETTVSLLSCKVMICFMCKWFFI